MNASEFQSSRKFADTPFGRIAYVERGSGPVARRRRSRNVSANSLRVRYAGDSGGIKRKESTAAPTPGIIASAAL